MSVDTYPELTAEENRDLGPLDKILLSNQRKRAQTRAQSDEAGTIARTIVDPEGVARENKDREAEKARLREMLAELEAEADED